MIALLTGIVSEKLVDYTIVDVHGVGYGVSMTEQDQNQLTIGNEARIYIYENIKEDSHQLFGFLQASDKQLFEQLLKVKNVGPKVAMSVMSIGTADVVRSAIAGGDVKSLQSAKGVGKRAAEQIVVELRDKVGLLVSGSAEDIVTRSGVSANDEAAQALIALGYSEMDAALALKHVDVTLSTEERIKYALRGISS